MCAGDSSSDIGCPLRFQEVGLYRAPSPAAACRLGVGVGIQLEVLVVLLVVAAGDRLWSGGTRIEHALPGALAAEVITDRETQLLEGFPFLAHRLLKVDDAILERLASGVVGG